MAKMSSARIAAALTAAAVTLATVAIPFSPAAAAGADPVTVTVDGADVAAAAQNRNGLTFKGFGVLSANSTSALLLDYKAQHPDEYWELIETLFGGDHPIMNTVKIEMGNDRNTSTGPNPATMRSRDEYPNILREPGFQLAADAQLVAHGDIHVSILRWNRPTWVTSHQDQYIWYKNTVLAAYREFGVMVDTINPDTNETGSPDIQLYKDFSNWLRNDTTGYQGATAADPNNGFASEEEKSLYRAIQTVAADTVGTPPVSFGNAMTSPTDSSLRDAVDIVGFHYSSADDSAGNMKKIAEQLDLEVWNSEGQSTFSSSADRPNNNASNEQGGFGTKFGGTNSALEMGNWVTTGFAASRRTLNIFQPAIGSFYDGFQYSSKELVNAREPWSGWLYYDGGLSVIEQFTQFAKLGWENADNTAGIWRAIPQASRSELGTGNPPSGARAGGASYTTLAAPDASDFSTVIVNDSSFEKTYRIATNGLSLGSDATVELWETRAADEGEAYDANYLQPIGELAPSADGSYSVTVKPWSALTVTTLDHATTGAGGALTAKDGYGSSLPRTPEYTEADGGRDVLDTDSSGAVNGVTDDGILYADDFDYREQAAIQGYDPATGQLVDTGETFLDARGARAKPEGTPAVQAEDLGVTPRYTNDTNGAFESVSTSDAAHGRVLRQQVGPGMAGGAWNAGDPKTTIGDARWANYTVSADVLFEASGSQYATIGAREQGGTPNGQNVSAAELRIDPAGAWTFMRYGTTLSSGSVAGNPAVGFAAGAGAWNTVAVKVAGNVYSALVNGAEVATYTDAAPQAAGRIQLGSSFSFVQFDNLRVDTVPGYTPYYDSIIDGMHQTSWDDVSAPVLEFDGSWSHVNGQGMFEWQRTASKSTAKGAALTYAFTGTGLDIIGTNNGATTLDVIVDGVTVAAAAPTFAAGSEKTTFMLRGLESAPHTVVIRTANDSSINVDAVGVITATADSASVDTAALSAAIDEVTGHEESEYSAETWGVFAAVLANAQKAVDSPVRYGLDAEGAAAIAARLTAAVDGLTPKDVSPDVLDLGVVTILSNERTLPASLDLAGTDAEVSWSLASTAAAETTAELSTFAATGRSTEKLSSGYYQRFSATVLVVPADLEYFIDSGSGGGDGSAHAGVAASFPELRNDAADQKWDGASAGPTWGYSTAATTLQAGSPRDWGSSFVGADYNKPVTYHLTLPSGSYNIVAVQAPRAGLTTNVYSKVRAAGAETTKTAVSTGAATPVAQTMTLETDAVVDVEFGTNGTSGYNARLALVYVQRIPRDLGVQGALEPAEELPETVVVAGAEKAVEWDADSAAQARTEYAKLTVTGRLSESGERVVAAFEIVPPALVYYIDAGTGGVASPQYSAVAATAEGLRNDAVDQVSASVDQWGYVADGMKVKGATDINDKYSTGLYQDTTRLTYRLPLEAGTYTLTGGFTEWWNLNRTMNHTVSVGGAELAKGNIPLSGSNSPLAAPLTFTLAAPATVEYVVTNEGAGGERPVISWLAVADVTRPGAPQNATADRASDTSIAVAWDAPALTGPGFAGYRVYEAGGSEPVCETTATTCTVSSLELGSTHAYEVAGHNELGEGERSAATASVTLPEVPSDDGARTAPARASLTSNDGWDTGLEDGTFQVTMNLWWGENGSLFKLYRDGELVAKVPLTMSSPGAQRAVVDIEGLPNGTYAFTGELVNSKGTTATQPLTVTVTDANPGTPSISAANKDGDGTYTVKADLWWGTNATSYRFLENGVEAGSGTLVAETPRAQHATLEVTGKPVGTYVYVVEFTNAAGTTASKELTVKVGK